MNLTYKSSIKHNEGIAKCSNLDPLLRNGSPLQSDIKRQSSDTLVVKMFGVPFYSKMAPGEVGV